MSACTRCEAAIEDGDLRCPICAFVVVVARGSLKRAHAQILRCSDCAAAIAYSAEKQAPACAFCGATMKVEVPIDPIEVAQLRIPFKVGREDATSALRGWLGKRGWFAPKTLKDEAVLDSLQPLCWAGWIVNATASVAWAADSDADSHRSAWAPHAGQVSMSFNNIVVPASRGLDHEECRLLIPYYDLRDVVHVDRPDSVESTVESFDAQRSAARRQVQEAIELTAKVRVEEHIPGRRYRNVHVACLLEGQKTDRVALPAWVMAYRYRDTPYRAIVHGQRGEVVFGTSPKDWVKIMTVVILGLVVVAAIAALLGYLNR
ncbi:MAG: zinc ribbon domain-containing protein [Deltaproteobacteria bacterium]|nr:zinc ribbon domain-containing protein [Deltaproteobacteria bacterium]